MIRHLLKLVWSRKRANALLIVEIFFSFLVVFAVITMAAVMINRWRTPLGFEYHDVWRARVAFPSQAESTPESEEKQRAAMLQMLREVRTLPDVEAVATAGCPAYASSTWTSVLHLGNRTVDVMRDDVSDDYAKVMRIPILRGRWFNADDDAANGRTAVIDADAAREIFGTLDAIGKNVQEGAKDVYRVIGVVAPFRKDGELGNDRVRMVFSRVSLTRKQGSVSRDVLLRVRPGTPADFEQTLIRTLHGVTPELAAPRVQHMDQMRVTMNRIYFAPAIVGGTVAAFLIVMVVLGLSGVLWQNITRRTREIGLRRALGATSAAVNRQVLAEVALLATLGVIVGVIIIAQLPILGIFHLVTPLAYTTGLTGALATIYGLTLLCGLYPSVLAGRVQPAHALHYE